jgi:ribonuclease P protein component
MTRRYTFPRSHRLGGRKAFGAVFDGKVRESRGPLSALAIPNGLDRLRVGIAIGRAVGNAAKRNRIKRLLRESVRLTQHDLPSGYDVVIVVRPHRPLALEGYQELVRGLLAKLHNRYDEAAKP